MVESAASTLQQRFGPPPPLAVVLGSGLSALLEGLERRQEAPYEELGLPRTGVPGHPGRLVLGELSGQSVAFLAGRVHLYEGHPPDMVVRAVRVLAAWGVRGLLLTSSVGAVRAGCAPTDLLVVRDHLNFQGVNPLTGPAYGTRFPDLTQAYDPRFRRHLVDALVEEGLPPHQGILAATSGPTYETPAEVRMLRLLGADVVGMSTVPEVLAAAEVGLRCAALVVISNAAAGISGEALSHTEVTDAARASAERLQRVLQRVLPALVREVS